MPAYRQVNLSAFDGKIRQFENACLPAGKPVRLRRKNETGMPEEHCESSKPIHYSLLIINFQLFIIYSLSLTLTYL